jgi:hypothetical protein
MPPRMRSSSAMQDELVARLHRALEARTVDADEVVHRLIVGRHTQRSRTPAAPQPAPAPRASARPASPAGAGKWPVKKGSFMVTFLMPDASCLLDVQHPVNQQKRIAVRQLA